MTISLTIDNCDALPDGGPLNYRAERGGFEIGREDRDWTLPDPNMFISGRHCEVRFENGAYWLHDFSRNGTFVNGSRQRVKSPYLLNDGDRLQIGHYLISVSIKPVREPETGDAEPAAFQPTPGNINDIWDTGAPSPPPISRRDLMPAQAKGRRSADFAEQFLELPSVKPDFDLESGRARDHQPALPKADPFAQPPAGESPFGASPHGGRAAYPAPDPAPPLPRSASFPFESEPLVAPSKPFVDSPQPMQPAASPPSPPEPATSGGAEATLRAIAAGAGVSPDIFLQRQSADVAAEIGVVLRTIVEELALLLKARAAAKVLAKSGNRTMVSAVDNNPLKFVPRAEEVLEIMFSKRRAGYLDAKHSIDEAFRDLKTHEFATYAAMQTALSRLLEDLSPDAIEKKVSSSTFSSKKARSWEIFVATWEAKEKPHENGMLDVFLAYFSDAYAKASKPK
jgi:type VI secretion system protein ImpI